MSYTHIVISRAIIFLQSDIPKHTKNKSRQNPIKKHSSNPQKGDKREAEENQETIKLCT